MQEIFNREPVNVSQTVLNKWKELGPFDVIAAFNQGQIKFDPNLEIKKIDYFKEGQITDDCLHVLHGIGRYDSDYLKEGAFSTDYLNGYCRRIYSDGSYYVGYFLNDILHG